MIMSMNMKLPFRVAPTASASPTWCRRPPRGTCLERTTRVGRQRQAWWSARAHPAAPGPFLWSDPRRRPPALEDAVAFQTVASGNKRSRRGPTTADFATLSFNPRRDGNAPNRTSRPSPSCPSAASWRPALAVRSASTAAGGGAAGGADDAAMDDEYGAMSSAGRTYVRPNYRLELHGTFGHRGHISTSRLPRGALDPAVLTYNTYGTLNAARDNVLVVCHALTGNADLAGWWGELLGPGRAFDTDRYFVVCCNILGSCYGSTGPSSPQPVQGGDAEDRPIYGVDFPDVR